MTNAMTNQPFDPTDEMEWEAISDESLELSLEQIDRAVQWSQPIADAEQQWQVYLQGLALVAFKQWLEEWAPDLKVNDRQCSIYQPAIAGLVDTVCNLEIGSFKLCLIITQNLADAVVNVPKAVVHLPQFVSHLYVLLEINEEQM